jgi:hypothetical protein
MAASDAVYDATGLDRSQGGKREGVVSRCPTVPLKEQIVEHCAFKLVGPTRLTFGDKTLELHDDGSVSGDRDAVVSAMEKAADEAPYGRR